jgi:hypothetical protein
LLLFLWQLFGPNPAIVVSTRTTYITAPLRANGMPDYGKWLLERQRQGVTPENNAAVLMWQALGPGDMDAKQFSLICTELGIDPVSTEWDCLQGVVQEANIQRLMAWMRDERRLDGEDSPTVSELETEEDYSGLSSDSEAYRQQDIDDAVEIKNHAASRLWTSAGIPPLAEWVAENKRPLDLLVAASQRSHYYSPSPSQLDGSDEMLCAMPLPLLWLARSSTEALSVRAMWHLGESRTEEAWQDLLSIYRMARCISGDETHAANYSIIDMENIAIEATQALLGQDDLTVEQARRVHCDLASLPAYTCISASYDRIERVSFLDAAIRLDATGEIGNPYFDFPPIVLKLRELNIDWNIVLYEGNKWYDRLAAATALPTRAARQAACEKINDDIEQHGHDLSRLTSMATGVLSRQKRSEYMAFAMAITFFWPLGQTSYGHLIQAEDRVNTKLELVRLAAALAVYRAEQGRYPAKLKDLVPDIVDSLPLDIYSGNPFVYKSDADGAGYVLYSVFFNGADDGGTDYSGNIIDGEWVEDRQEVDFSASDLVICLPVPPLKLPEVVTGNESAP